MKFYPTLHTKALICLLLCLLTAALLAQPSYAPKTILLNAGGNDLSAGETPEQIRDVVQPDGKLKQGLLQRNGEPYPDYASQIAAFNRQTLDALYKGLKP